MRSIRFWMLVIAMAGVIDRTTASLAAQEREAETREAALEQAQSEKVAGLHPYTPGKVEGLRN